MKIRKRAWLLALLAVCAVLFAGCTTKWCSISKYDVKEMISVLEDPCRKYTLKECFTAVGTLEEYFNEIGAENTEAKNAFEVVSTYIDSMIDAEDTVLGILVNLE